MYLIKLFKEGMEIESQVWPAQIPGKSGEECAQAISESMLKSAHDPNAFTTIEWSKPWGFEDSGAYVY